MRNGIPTVVPKGVKIISASTTLNKKKAYLKEDILSLFDLGNFCNCLLELSYLQGELACWDLEESMACIYMMREENENAYLEFI